MHKPTYAEMDKAVQHAAGMQAIHQNLPIDSPQWRKHVLAEADLIGWLDAARTHSMLRHSLEECLKSVNRRLEWKT